jgi:hypothetical protein
LRDSFSKEPFLLRQDERRKNDKKSALQNFLLQRAFQTLIMGVYSEIPRKQQMPPAHFQILNRGFLAAMLL